MQFSRNALTPVIYNIYGYGISFVIPVANILVIIVVIAMAINLFIFVIIIGVILMVIIMVTIVVIFVCDYDSRVEIIKRTRKWRRKSTSP